MRAIKASFIQMLSSIRDDMMLVMICFVPILMGCLFRFGLPILENTLTNHYNVSSIMAPYFALADMFYAMVTPTMFCFVSAMVILEETDDKITRYLFISPLGQKGYLFSRFAIPAGIACCLSMLLLSVFHISALDFLQIIFLSISGAMQGVIISLLVVTISSNKLEGMAVMKFSTLMILGVIVPFVVHDTLQYVVAFLPSFWIGKAILCHSLLNMIFALVTEIIWIAVLMKKVKTV